MESRKDSKRRRNARLALLVLFVVVMFCVVAILWEEPVTAPEQKIDSESIPVQNTAIEPPPTAEEIQAKHNEYIEFLEKQQQLETERIRLELRAAEEPYYVSQFSEVALQLEWTIMPTIVSQGDVLLVRHQEEQEVTFGDRTYELQPFGSGYYTYIPVLVDMKPGDYTLGDQIVTVEAHDFETQYLEVTSEMESMRRDTERIRADQLKIDEARSHSEPDFLFPSDSEFLKPIEGILTTPFGYSRYVNGTLSGRHMALDLALPQGTPIMATNDGIVVLSEELYLTGNAIYIDHGMGLFSQYAHLFELHVEVGDKVKQGDVIGLVGTTGFSTGPHLHFAFWAHNVPVNPNLFFGKTPFHWFKGPSDHKTLTMTPL